MYIDEETITLLMIIFNVWAVMMVLIFVFLFVILPVSVKKIDDKKDGEDLWLDIQWKT